MGSWTSCDEPLRCSLSGTHLLCIIQVQLRCQFIQVDSHSTVQWIFPTNQRTILFPKMHRTSNSSHKNLVSHVCAVSCRYLSPSFKLYDCMVPSMNAKNVKSKAQPSSWNHVVHYIDKFVHRQADCPRVYREATTKWRQKGNKWTW